MPKVSKSESRALNANSRLRSMVYTLNNYTPEEEAYLKAFSDCSYHVFGKEIAEEKGTPHLQGYMEFGRQVRFGYIKRNFERMHVEERKAPYAVDAANYCKKGEQTHEEWEKYGIDGPNYGKNYQGHEMGNISAQGERNDLNEMVHDIMQGKPELQIALQHTATYAKHMPFYRRMKYLLAKEQAPRFVNVEVIVLWGKAGTGKTKRAYDIDPKLFFVPPMSSGVQWYCNYDGEETILFDEFEGQIPLREMKVITDGYAHQERAKGSSVWKAWKRVILTSNKNPEEWWLGGMDDGMRRRITQIVEM